MKSKNNSIDRDLFAIEIGQRIREIRTGLGLKQAEFSRLVGFSSNFLSEVERGKKIPSAHIVASLSRVSDKSADWILTGESPRPSRGSDSAAISIPLFLSPVSAGLPTPVEQEHEWYRLPGDLVPHPDYFMVRVAGDSMVGAGIRYGDLLLVDRRESPRRGSIVIAVVDGDTCVKRLEITDKGDTRKVYLYPENASYKPIEITDHEGAIQGVVKCLLRDIER